MTVEEERKLYEKYKKEIHWENNHENEDEIFVIVKGQAEADDNGTLSILNAGDTLLTGNGAGHSIRNIGEEDLELVAVISTY